jgi:predicted GNAT family N-acyltransferase
VNLDYRVEALGASHDRTAFHSGVPELDHYFQHQAGQDARRKAAAPFVMLDRQDTIVGYYTLSAFGVQLPEFPEAVVRKLPRYPVLPATLLGRLAISRTHQGKSLGRFLLMDALYRSWKNTSEVGSVGVVVDALDQKSRAFYLHHEFIQLRDCPNRLFRAMADIERAFKTR